MKKKVIGKELSSAKADLDATETELGTLRQRVQELEKAADAAEQEDGVSKRDVIKVAWVAPVVMAVNLPNSVFAQSATSPVPSPTATPAPTTTPAPTVTPAPIG